LAIGMPGLHDRLKADVVESVDHRVKVIQRVLVAGIWPCHARVNA
jgi:hypothetical protein